MPIEILDDVIEDIANELGRYGAHGEQCSTGKKMCRCCWTSGLRERIVAAVEVERKLAAPAPADRREQAISFAHGNVSLHNPAVTREMVAEQYDKLHPAPATETIPAFLLPSTEAVADRIADAVAPEVVEFKFCPNCRQDFAGYKSRVACPACLGGKNG